MSGLFERPTNRLDALAMLNDASAVLQLLIELCTGYESEGIGLSTGGVRGLVVTLTACHTVLNAACEVLDERAPGMDPGAVM